MIVALFALSAVMIIGGLLAAILGWDIVLIERGWTMVIAGSVMAASGALLLGITAAVAKLVQIQDELIRLHTGLNEDQEEPALPPPSSAAGISLAALAGGIFSKAKGGRDEDRDQAPILAEADRPGSSFDRPPPPEPPPVPEPLRPAAAAAEPKPAAADRVPEEEITEAKVPEFLFAERYRETTTERHVSTSAADEDLFGIPEPVPEPPAATVAQEPEAAPAGEEEREPEAEPGPEPEPKAEQGAVNEEQRGEEPVAEAAAEEPEEARSPSTVIGTYTSGDNTYVMFADGSIEAQTPQGVYRFKSLDELKEFIASGGENAKPDEA